MFGPGDWDKSIREKSKCEAKMAWIQSRKVGLHVIDAVRHTLVSFIVNLAIATDNRTPLATQFSFNEWAFLIFFLPSPRPLVSRNFRLPFIHSPLYLCVLWWLNWGVHVAINPPNSIIIGFYRLVLYNWVGFNLNFYQMNRDTLKTTVNPPINEKGQSTCQSCWIVVPN